MHLHVHTVLNGGVQAGLGVVVLAQFHTAGGQCVAHRAVDQPQVVGLAIRRDGEIHRPLDVQAGLIAVVGSVVHIVALFGHDALSCISFCGSSRWVMTTWLAPSESVMRTRCSA